MSREREITTLGRGGSDTTAVALAGALGAEHCEIYSDVDGVYTADPNRVPGARHLPAIDYETMEEMASAGARVLNVHAVRTAREHGLCVLARRTADFVGSVTGRETRVVAGANPVSAIVVDMTLALAYGSPELRAPLREAANLAELPLRELDLGDTLPLAAIPLGGVPDAAGALETLKRALPELRVVSGFAELSVVGVAARPGRESTARDALPVAPLCAWRTPRRHSALLPLEHVAEAERRWHALFVENAGSAPSADAFGH
jgi:aspartate kinase